MGDSFFSSFSLPRASGPLSSNRAAISFASALSIVARELIREEALDVLLELLGGVSCHPNRFVVGEGAGLAGNLGNAEQLRHTGEILRPVEPRDPPIEAARIKALALREILRREAVLAHSQGAETESAEDQIDMIGRVGSRRLGTQECLNVLTGGFDRGLGRVVGGDLIGRGGRGFLVFGAQEYTSEGVVIGGRNRVELVVVAAGAGDGQAKKAAGHGVDAIVDLVELLGITVVDRPQHEEPESSQAIDPAGLVEKVAGNLLRDKAVIRHIVVEGSRHPVAISEAVRIKPWLEGMGLVLAVSSDVEPVTAPALAVAR